MTHRRQKFKKRNGLSLLEVILAIAILGGSLVVIGQLLRSGVIHAINTRLNTEATLLCDAKMAELSAGVLELKSYGQTTIQDSPGWYYEVDLQQSGEQGLLLVMLTVGQENVEDPLTVTVRRFMPDPDYDPTAIEEFE